MSMEKIDEKELIELQNKYDFKLAKVKGTEIVNIIKNESPRFEIIDRDEFFRILKKRRLSVYRSQNDFLKIMKDK
jgi:hypothetical protein